MSTLRGVGQARPIGRLPAALLPARAGARVGLGAYAVQLALVAGLYVGAAKLGIALSVAHGVITPVWAPTGIALAALVLFGPRVWPAVMLGALIANETSGASLPVAAAISVGNTLEAVVGATLLRRVGFRPALERVRDVFALVLLAALASTTVSATNGTAALWLAGDLSGSDYGSEWLLWWIGDAMGDLVVAPLLLVWATVPPRKLGRPRTLEGLALLGLLVGVSSFVFLAGYWRYPHLLFPLLVWAPLRFRQPGATAASFVVTAIAIAGAVSGNAPLATGNSTQVVQVLEGLLAALALGLLILGAVLAERSAAERKLERAHAALTEAQKVARIGSWEWDIGDNQVAWSDELYRLFGLEPQSVAVTYESFIERVHPDDREPVRRAVERALEERSPFAFEHRIVLPDGRGRWLEGRGRVVTDDTGEPVRMVGTSRDVTDRKPLEELRDTVLSAVSHELRTPLTSILGFAVTLRERKTGLTEDARTEMVARLAEEARRLDRLLADLLDLDRLRHGVMRPSFRAVDVGKLVAEVAAEHAAGGYPIEVRAGEIVAEVDGPKVERIVDNLLANAVRHTPPDTRIDVRVERVDDDVLIAVDDRGPGVLAEDRDAIFGVFNRGGDGVTGPPGTGIGLSLVAQFAALRRPRLGGGEPGRRRVVSRSPADSASRLDRSPRSCLNLCRMRLAAARGLCFLSIALAAGCGGEDRAASRAAAPASTPSTPATTTAAAATGPTSEEAAWLGKASVSALMVKVDKDAAAFARTGTITLDISSIGGGEGECRQTLGSAGTPPTARLERVRKLARGACVQAERAADQMTPYTLTKKSGEVIEHPADPAAAAASMKRARKLAAQAQAALAAVEEG